MIRVEVSSNAADVSQFFRRMFADQMPFATSLAINMTAKDFQEAERSGLRDRFTIRRAWVLQGIKINRGDFATKRKLSAFIQVDPARDFLTKFEEGGRKTATGASRLAVPKEARRTKTGIISRSQRPRSLGFKEIGGGVARGRQRTVLIRRPGGRGLILQRFGRRGRSNTRVLFTFTPSVRIDAILKFEETARATIRDRFEANFSTAFDRAVRGAR